MLKLGVELEVQESELEEQAVCGHSKNILAEIQCLSKSNLTMNATSILDFKPSLPRNASFKCHGFDHAVEVNSRLPTITNTSQISLGEGGGEGEGEKNVWGGSCPP